ncbi:TonB-dependent receptor [Aequorivita sp. SDUM287046]|uniref:TonB-dependent receptor n=1 Tax=Aequorivita aurantiaca TaxID=3053356 RepID=A0ABT8DK32_9FLAO|nr:outer membrane beta-barrel protein [Aequorivita aurantiaca]MDN3725413.1 TonB-dependent receptor [Aequorivita aurantiaca]
MKRLLILFFCVLFMNTSAFANEPLGRIYGSVMDGELAKPIPYATVVITDSKGELVSGISTTEDGAFNIEKIPNGTYTVKVQFMGYKPYTTEIVISAQQPNHNLNIIELHPDVAMLDSVTVVAERTTIEQRIDRKVINVGKDLTTAGATAADIMNNIPSVHVDQDGNIALRGNANVRILVDGKPSHMDAAQLLRQIPSTSIKSIELITNPSAKYNPEGMSGIINIVLHKNANDGFNGNVNLGVTASEHTRYNGTLDLNYRKDKLNFYGNFGGNIGERLNQGTVNLYEDDYRQKFQIVDSEASYLYKLGVDFFLNDRNTFSFYTNQNVYTGEPTGGIDIIYPNNPTLDLRQNIFMNNENTNSTYNFAADHKFNDDGHKIILEANLNQLDRNEDSNFSFEGNTGNLEAYHDLVNENIEIFTTNVDYENPLSETAKLEVGVEAQLMDTDNAYNTDSNLYTDATYQYKRDIYSFYSTFGQNFEKWSYQLGARLENYKVDAVYNGEEVYSDEIFSVYPSGFVNYTPSESNSYQMSYSRRVDRPSFGQVNPIRDVSSPRLTVSGNPELRPQFTNSFEINYTKKFEKKGSVTAGVFFRNMNDEINQIFSEDPNEDGSLLIQFANFEDNNSYGIELSTNYKFTDWWSTNTSFEAYGQKVKGIVGEESLEVDNTAWTIRTSHSFKTTEQLTLQLFGFYRSASHELQFDMEPMFFMNFGARYSFLNDAAMFSLNFNDLFNTQEFKFTNGRPIAHEGEFKGVTQNVYLGFTYRFGGAESKNLKRKEREKNELNGGGMF